MCVIQRQHECVHLFASSWFCLFAALKLYCSINLCPRWTGIPSFTLSFVSQRMTHCSITLSWLTYSFIYQCLLHVHDLYFCVVTLVLYIFTIVQSSILMYLGKQLLILVFIWIMHQCLLYMYLSQHLHVLVVLNSVI